MTLTDGLLMGFLGCSITIIGFFIAYMIANKDKKTKKQIEDEERLRKIFPDFKIKQPG